MDADASTWREDAPHFDVLRIHEPDQILHDQVHTILVEGSVRAEAEEVELEAFTLDHLHVRDVVDRDLGEIWLARDGAEAGELGAVEVHAVITLRVAVGEGLQHLGRIILTVVRLLTQEGQFSFFHAAKVFQRTFCP